MAKVPDPKLSMPPDEVGKEGGNFRLGTGITVSQPVPASPPTPLPPSSGGWRQVGEPEESAP
jgi:hypothetical protein